MADTSQAADQANSSSPSQRQKGFLQKWWIAVFGEPEQKPPAGAGGTTERLIQILWVLIILGLLVELAYGWSLTENRTYFVTWAWIASLASALAGAVLGLLFGLPSIPLARPARVEAPQSSSAPSSSSANSSGAGDPGKSTQAQNSAEQNGPGDTRSEQEVPYGESTSLEQIADWLTKIIVGLTLTQYDSWSKRFDTLASSLTFRLLGQQGGCAVSKKSEALPALCQPIGAIPGGSIIVAFALLGFLVTYFWMRRFFIIEMVVSKRQAHELMNSRAAADLAEQRARTEKAVQEAQQAKAAAVKATAEDVLDMAEAQDTKQKDTPAAAKSFATAEAAILKNADQLVPKDDRALAALLEIKEGPASTLPDDPWLGRFGGNAEAGGARLIASVSQLEGSQFFELNLEVQAVGLGRIAELTGTTALFFLHPTFGDRPRTVVFGSDGRAPLQLYAYGAFTVGVLLQDGTKLEINLATIPNAPDLFRSR